MAGKGEAGGETDGEARGETNGEAGGETEGEVGKTEGKTKTDGEVGGEIRDVGGKEADGRVDRALPSMAGSRLFKNSHSSGYCVSLEGWGTAKMAELVLSSLSLNSESLVLSVSSELSESDDNLVTTLFLPFLVVE